MLLEIHDLNTRFGSHWVHKNLSVSFKRGEVTAIMGGSGSGKSSLINFIMFGNRNSTGSLVWEGKPWDRSSIERKIGLAPQNGGFLSKYTVLENIAIPLIYVLGIPKDIAHELGWASMQTHDLGQEICHQYAETLSGGTLRRASIARALILEQELLILDEPLSGLDKVNSDKMIDLIMSLVPKATVICVTHHFIPAHQYILIHEGTATPGSYEEVIKTEVGRRFLEKT